MSEKKSNIGIVKAVEGSVVVVYFEKKLPPIYTKLVCNLDNEKQIVVEVEDHIDIHHIRGVAITSTQGLSRGDEMIDTDVNFLRFALSTISHFLYFSII